MAERRTLIGGLVAAASAAALPVALLGVALTATAIFYAATHFSLSTNEDDLISPKLAYRQAEVRLADTFPSLDPSIAVVIDGQTPELAEAAAATLTDKLSHDPAMFPQVWRANGGGFWAREGLLYLPLASVKATHDSLIQAQPFLGPIAADPSLSGLMTSLSTVMMGSAPGAPPPAQFATPMKKLAYTLEALEAGKPAFFSWQAMLGGDAGSAARQVVLVDPKLDYTQLEPGAAATDAIHAAANSLGLDHAHGVAVRLTGGTPMEDDEFGSLADRALPITIVAVCAIVLMLWLAVRSARVIGAILFTTLAGLAAAAAIGLAIFHTFNVISIAFIPLFVGLGIDFGIQLSVRHRTEHIPGVTNREALARAGDRMGAPLSLAAVAIAAGFLAFAPTAYIGVSQLGMIAGLGMLIALAFNLTLLPALITLLGPPATPPGPPPREITRLDQTVLANRRLVLGVSVAAAVVCAALLPLVRFDFNPLHMRDPKSQSVIGFNELQSDPDLTPNTLSSVQPSLAAADALAAKLARLPEVGRAETLSDLVPADQPAKLALIADAANLLDLTLNPLVTSPPPSDAETVRSLEDAATALRRPTGADAASVQARRLADALDKLAKADPALRAKASAALMTPFATMLSQIQAMLKAQPVTLASLPPEVTRDWITADGRARVAVAPKGDPNDNAVLGRFIDAVSRVAPDAVGPPYGIREGGRTVVSAFTEAGVLSFIVITLLLFAVLRRVRDVAITMAPIVLTGLLTMGSCVIIGQPLNFANIIALPLLFGIGVAFHIYFVMSWRAGGSHLLTSSLARAVFFSALTTATGFGSLWLSSHPGTASMGKLLMISLIWTLVSALIFQPALMGAPPKRAAA